MKLINCQALKVGSLRSLTNQLSFVCSYRIKVVLVQTSVQVHVFPTWSLPRPFPPKLQSYQSQNTSVFSYFRPSLHQKNKQGTIRTQ